jgi:hypothetical protein
MTTRLYLRAVAVVDEPPAVESIAVDRFFVNSFAPTEIWVETEAATTPDPGKAGVFHLSQNMEIGFRTVRGTVERKLRK